MNGPALTFQRQDIAGSDQPIMALIREGMRRGMRTIHSGAQASASRKESMMLKTFTHCAVILLLVFASTARAGETREQTYVIGADVNSQGQVTQTQVDADVSKGIAGFLDLALKRWQFIPAQQDGKAVVVHTFIEAKLEVIPADAGKYTLRVSYVKHGPRWDNRPPAYPVRAIRERDTGVIVLLGRMDQKGRFEVSETRAVLANGNPRSTLKQAARTWLTSLKALPETVNGKPVGADARIIVNFRLNKFIYGREMPASGRPYSKGEQQLLLDTGFKPPFDKDGFDAHSVSSVLQTRMINPVTMHL